MVWHDGIEISGHLQLKWKLKKWKKATSNISFMQKVRFDNHVNLAVLLLYRVATLLALAGNTSRSGLRATSFRPWWRLLVRKLWVSLFVRCLIKVTLPEKSNNWFFSYYRRRRRGNFGNQCCLHAINAYAINM